MNTTTLTETLNTAIETHAFSGAISIRHKGDILYENAAGYADRSNRLPNTLDTRFGTASGTKFFTALAIGKLIEAGKLDFDTRVADCVPWPFPQYDDTVTIRQLLTHTSGIPDYYDEEVIEDFDNFKVAVPWSELTTPRDYLPVFPDKPMKFAPEARFSYSNGGYIMLGVVIEELSGLLYRDFVTQEVFLPAGMTRSGYFAMNKLPEKTAFGYIEEEDGGWRTNIFTLPIIGASDGGAFTTVDDLAKLWKAFWDGQILPPEMVKTYIQPYSEAPSEGPHKYYGHGIWIHNEEGRAYEEYIVGCDAGVSMKSGVIRDKDLLVTVLSNTTNGAWPILHAITEALA